MTGRIWISTEGRRLMPANASIACLEQKGKFDEQKNSQRQAVRKTLGHCRDFSVGIFAIGGCTNEGNRNSGGSRQRGKKHQGQDLGDFVSGWPRFSRRSV